MVLRVLVFRKMLSDREAMRFTSWYTVGRVLKEDIHEPGMDGAKAAPETPMDSLCVEGSFLALSGGANVAPDGLS